MKNQIILTLGAISLFFTGCFFNETKTSATSNQKEEELIQSITVAAQATFAEQGHYPKTLKEIGFAPAGKLEHSIHYKSLGSSYILSVKNKKTGQVVSMESTNNKVVNSDLLANDPQADSL